MYILKFKQKNVIDKQIYNYFFDYDSKYLYALHLQPKA